MAGNTATIDVQAFRCQWDAGIPITTMCCHWTITKDQLLRLKGVFGLCARNDRSRKRKQLEEPEEAEDRVSAMSLALAPSIAERAAIVRQGWTLEVEHSRRGSRSGGSIASSRRVISLATIRDTIRQSDLE